MLLEEDERMLSEVIKEKQIRNIVTIYINEFCKNFKSRHINELNDANGTINSKINNVFIAELGDKFLYNSAMIRSFDSSFGKMIENLATEIAEINYEVKKSVGLSIRKTNK